METEHAIPFWSTLIISQVAAMLGYIYLAIGWITFSGLILLTSYLSGGKR